jgi:hypothetical protein
MLTATISQIFCRVAASLIPEEFDQFVAEKLQEQEEEYASKRNTQFKAIPDFVDLIHQSGALSSKLIV